MGTLPISISYAGSDWAGDILNILHVTDRCPTPLLYSLIFPRSKQNSDSNCLAMPPSPTISKFSLRNQDRHNCTSISCELERWSNWYTWMSEEKVSESKRADLVIGVRGEVTQPQASFISLLSIVEEWSFFPVLPSPSPSYTINHFQNSNNSSSDIGKN